MSLTSFIDQIASEVVTERQLAKTADELLAVQGRRQVEAFFAQHYPKFWAAAQDSITGCVVIRLAEVIGLSGEGAVALVVDDRFLVYTYRNAAHDQITVDHYLQGDKLPKARKTYYGRIHYDAPARPNMENDRILADLFSLALDDIANP